ncbi:MMPL family transporter [Streptomyces rapamycinicus]|uniref:Membrane protein n=2 Tax=Streptomyces rapamycinicus TaxID=1226757 RepID=A0A3L8RM58_STRRN|nr:MMPL family transporter [Streptomyces rapamycinicus]MBB4783967.1 RND superfamily putative drug exporter [Streptomyces rapamycinicus]RLV80548.1 membrane protein [Streptomyces rapamycinicus NRRL 5491]UTO64320.1 MMPL family transporter [Streptomyces rapamycinicus]UTP32276.1 MMPL family transporter [Streptomyces rapamycinicus NRRL 5491]
MKSLTVRMARWSARHPWRAIVGWLVFVALCLGAGSAVGTHSATTADYRVGEAGRAEAMAAEGGLERRATEQVLISARSGALDRDAAEAAAGELTARMERLPEVAGVAGPLLSGDRRILMVEVALQGEERDAKDKVDALTGQTGAVAKAYPGLRLEETGSPSISKGVDQQRGDDLALSEKITLPITLITLLVVFGSVTMAGVPLLLALSSIAAAIGLSMVASHVSPDAGVGTNVILMIGLAVGVDYTLFYLKREREERARSGGRLSSEALVDMAAATSGRAVVVSGLAVVASTATLYLASDVIFSSLATGTIVVVLVAVASSLTALPAMLVKLGEREERGARRRAERGKPARRTRGNGGGRVWAALLRPASRHPLATLCVSVLALLALVIPLAGLKITEMSRDTHSRDIAAMRVYDRLNEAFPDQRVTHQVVVRADAGRSGEVGGALRELARRADADPLFTGASRVRTSADHRISTLDLKVPYLGNSDQAYDSLDHLREDYLPATVGRVDGAEFGVSGDVARYADYPAHQNGKLPLVLGALLLVTFAMTAYAFRSLVLALIGVLLNVLSAAAALGLLVLVFQGTWAEGLLDFHSTGSIGSRVPLFLFVILFGLSMDYQVFVVSRIREAVLAGTSTRQAVLDGIRRSASVVTSAAVVMTTVFVSFVFLHIIEMKQIGFVLAAAVLLDAFIIRIMVLPSAMLLLGEASWWPSRAAGRTAVASSRTADGRPAVDVR